MPRRLALFLHWTVQCPGPSVQGVPGASIMISSAYLGGPAECPKDSSCTGTAFASGQGESVFTARAGKAARDVAKVGVHVYQVGLQWLPSVSKIRGVLRPY